MELIQLTDSDLSPLMEKPKLLADPFASILAHLDDAAATALAIDTYHGRVAIRRSQHA